MTHFNENSFRNISVTGTPVNATYCAMNHEITSPKQGRDMKGLEIS